MENLFSQEKSKALPQNLQKLLLQGKKAEALRLLEKQIESDGGLFHFDSSFQESRRLGWLLRIDLLREWNRISEALAWTCLECEINPNNVTAQALKEQLKRQLKLVPAKTTNTKSQMQPTLQNQFTSEMLLYNSWLACQADIRNNLKIITRLKIDNKVKSHFDKIVLPDLTGIKTLDGLKTKQEIQNIYNNSPEVSEENLNAKYEEFINVNPIEKFRGKFLLRFLESYLTRLQSIFGMANSPFENKYSCSLRIENVTMCSILTQYANTTECLKQYITVIAR